MTRSSRVWISKRYIFASSPNMSAQTPVLPCLEHSSITITPSLSPSHPLRHPAFTIPNPLLAHLEIASQHLHSSRTVAFATETVYGLGASALDPDAIKKIYLIKNRPADNPLIIHVSSLDMLQRLLPSSDVYEISKIQLALITAFWPGPLTLLFPSPNPSQPPALQTNAIRMPAHLLALALIHHSNLPLSAPSANFSGRPSPTQARHVYNDLNGAEGLGCILDGGDCGVGVESTVVNALGWKAGGGGSVDILRPGGLGVEEIARVVQEVDGRGDVTEIQMHGKPWRRNVEASSSRATHLSRTEPNLAPATPGLKYRHYSPRIPVYLLQPSNTFPRSSEIPSKTDSTPRAVLRKISADVQRNGRNPTLGLLHYEDSPLSRRVLDVSDLSIESISLGPTAESAAQRLFSGMLSLEGSAKYPANGSSSMGVDAILMEGCSDEGLGLAVMERIDKAVGGGGFGEGANAGLAQGVDSERRYWVDVS